MLWELWPAPPGVQPLQVLCDAIVAETVIRGGTIALQQAPNSPTSHVQDPQPQGSQLVVQAPVQLVPGLLWPLAEVRSATSTAGPVVDALIVTLTCRQGQSHSNLMLMDLM
jgi:hypothetical protein